MIRDIFNSLLISLFPDGYFTDDVLSFIERRENGEVATLDKSARDAIVEIITPLAIKHVTNLRDIQIPLNLSVLI